jgi:hypothetical protein
VGSGKHRETGPVPEIPDKSQGAFVIEKRGDLVQEENRALEKHCRDKGHTLLLSTGEVPHVLAEDMASETKALEEFQRLLFLPDKGGSSPVSKGTLEDFTYRTVSGVNLLGYIGNFAANSPD